MRLIFAAAALMLAPAVVHAADPAPAQAAPAQAPAARLSLDTPVEAIVADTAGKAVLDTDLPGVTTHAQYEMFKGMTLRQLSSMAPDKLTAEALAKVEADLAQVK